MQPGPIIVRKCPECEGLLLEQTWLSGNTFGATYWTDGRMVAPMDLIVHHVLKCHKCSHAGWKDEFENIDELYRFQVDEKHPEALNSLSFEMTDYIQMLDRDGNDRKQERYLRLHLWWARNDLRRGVKDADPLTNDDISNMNALIEFMDESEPNDRLMITELYREQREFNKAAATLREYPLGGDFALAAKLLQRLIEEENSDLVELRAD